MTRLLLLFDIVHQVISVLPLLVLLLWYILLVLCDQVLAKHLPTKLLPFLLLLTCRLSTGLCLFFLLEDLCADQVQVPGLLDQPGILVWVIVEVS